MSFIRLRGNPIQNLQFPGVPIDYRDYVKVDDASIFGHYYKVIEGRPFNCVLGQVVKWLSLTIASVTAVFTGGAATPLVAAAAYAGRLFKIIPPETFAVVGTVTQDKWRGDPQIERDRIRAAYKNRFDGIPLFTGGVPNEDFTKGLGWRGYRAWSSMSYSDFKSRFSALGAEIENVKNAIKASPCDNFNYRDLGALLYLYQYGQVVDLARTSQTSVFQVVDGEPEFQDSPNTQLGQNSGLKKMGLGLGLAFLASQV